MIQQVGDILDQLGVKADIDDDDMVASAVVVMAVLVPGSSNPRLTIANSDAMTWIEQAGLLTLAANICCEPPTDTED